MSSCDYWSSREYWSRLSERCEYIINKYDVPIPTDPHNDPLEVFEDSEVHKNVFHFMVFIDPFHKWLPI